MRLREHADWSGRDGHAAVTHNGAIYLMGGTQDPRSNFSDVWRSVNGREWVQVRPAAPDARPPPPLRLRRLSVCSLFCSMMWRPAGGWAGVGSF